MKYVINLNGSIKAYENTEQINQFSVNANKIYVAFDGLNIRDYVPYIAFERADKKTSPLIGMSFCEFTLNDTKYDGACYSFSDAWVTAISGELALSVILKRNKVTIYTSKINLFVSESVDNDDITYIDDVAYNELVSRLYVLETKFENGYVERAERDSLGNVIYETYETKNEAINKLNEVKQYTNAKVEEAKQHTNSSIATLEQNIQDGELIVGKALKDAFGNEISSSYEKKGIAQTYTDNKIVQLKQELLGTNVNEWYDTFSEIAEYIETDKTGATNMLNSILANTNNINVNTQEIAKLEQKLRSKGLTLRESIEYITTNELKGNWLFTNENQISNLQYNFIANNFVDSENNKFKAITFISVENTHYKVVGVTELEQYIELFNPITKTGLAYDKEGKLKDNYYLTFDVENDRILTLLKEVASKIKVSLNIVGDSFTYNGVPVSTTNDCVNLIINELYKPEEDYTTILNGKFKFKTFDSNTIIINSLIYSTNFKDSKGNNFSNIGVHIEENKISIYGDSNTLIYQDVFEISNGVRKHTLSGLATLNSSTIDDSYYIEFEGTNYEPLLQILKDSGVVTKFIPKYSGGNTNAAGFKIQVVESLPIKDISTNTIYLVPNDTDYSNIYNEYIYVNGNWEMLGFKIDLSGYVQLYQLPKRIALKGDNLMGYWKLKDKLPKFVPEVKAEIGYLAQYIGRPYYGIHIKPIFDEYINEYTHFTIYGTRTQGNTGEYEVKLYDSSDRTGVLANEESYLIFGDVENYMLLSVLNEIALRHGKIDQDSDTLIMYDEKHMSQFIFVTQDFLEGYVDENLDEKLGNIESILNTLNGVM